MANKPLPQEDLKELASVTAEKLGIQYPPIIEKDYYVTQIVHSLSGIENESFRLIFAGGTCLAKAHKIVKCMSEDINFKIQLKNTKKSPSKSRLLKELKKFRTQIMTSLTLPYLTVGSSIVQNEGQYLKVELNYLPLFADNQTLRPHLLLEFRFANIHLATNSLTINTIIEDVIPMDKIFSSLPINCMSTEETATEKWVGLTRRIIAIERQYHEDDETLVRHVYYLNAIKQVGKISNNIFILAKTIVDSDAKQFKNQHPEYFVNPNAEICQSLEILKNKGVWKERYHKFTNSMVYDKRNLLDYENAISELEDISKKIILSLDDQ